MIKYILLHVLFFLIVFIAHAQKKANKLPFIVRLEQKEFAEMPALQSFAFASWQGKWILMGGRKDGLHRRQPWASFNEEGQNDFIYVVDPVKEQVWKQSVQNLPVTIAEQLQSTNMEFYQIEERLILTGGYGYRKSKDDHITHPYLTVIKTDELIKAIIEGKEIANTMVQIRDERMAVTGGRLARTGDTLLLAGGQRFDGMYNPHGANHGPGFEQQYSNEIRKFLISYNNGIPAISFYTTLSDSVNLHRRDYNLVPQIFPGNEIGFTMFSGVFQYNVDLPFTNSVDIVSGNYKVNNDFQQKLNHYHCAVLPVYDKVTSGMYSIFFGGIAQYYPAVNGKLINDKNVPFTKTISIIYRSKENKLQENYLPIEMPGYLGASAEFIFMPDIKMYSAGIADAGLLKDEEVLIGYILGGISSTDKNVFFSNSGEESNAKGGIIKVYIRSSK